MGYCRYFLIIVGLIKFGTRLASRAVVGCTSHLELSHMACPPSLLYVSWCVCRLGALVNVCLYSLHAPWLMFRLQTHNKVLSQSPICSA